MRAAGEGQWSGDFRSWLMARGTAILAAEIAIVVLQLLVLEGDGSALAVASLRAAVTLPYLVLGPLAGAFADRVRRRPLMILSDVIAGTALFAAGLWASVVEPHAAILLGATFLVWSALVFFEAGSWGAILAIVGRDRLGQANSKIWALTSIAGLAGPFLAAWLASATTLTAVLFLASGLYFVSATLIFSIKVIREQGDRPSEKPRAIDGLRLIFRNKGLRDLIGIVSAVSFAMGAGSSVLVVYLAAPTERAGTYMDVGLVFAAGAAGALVASILFPWIRQVAGTRLIMLIGPVIYGASLAAFALVDDVVWLLLIWSVAHLTYTILLLDVVTVRQEATPAEQQGRVNTSARVITLSTMLIGTMTGGVIADFISAEMAYFAAAAVVAVFGTLLVVRRWTFLGGLDAEK